MNFKCEFTQLKNKCLCTQKKENWNNIQNDIGNYDGNEPFNIKINKYIQQNGLSNDFLNKYHLYEIFLVLNNCHL